MNTSLEYLQRAEECLKIAERARPWERFEILRMAQTWLLLAREAETEPLPVARNTRTE